MKINSITDNSKNERVLSKKKHGTISLVFGVMSVLIFLLDLIAIVLFWFHGAPADTGALYKKDAISLDVKKFPFCYSAAWQYPPVIYDFAESDTKHNGKVSELKYTWVRMNYLVQADPPEYPNRNPAIGVPSIIHVTDTTTIRTDLMQELQGKSHNAPQVVHVLSKRIVKLDSGWIAEIEIPEKSLNFYSPQSSGQYNSNPESKEIQVAFAPLLIPGSKPEISKSLDGYLDANEYPLIIAVGHSAPILVACSRGTLLKFTENGELIDKTSITLETSSSADSGSDKPASLSSLHDFWVPVGGVLMGRQLVGADTILIVRRIMVIILLSAPLIAYLAFAWAHDSRNLVLKKR